jgi:LytS/YehU family sensor histidine kinase
MKGVHHEWVNGTSRQSVTFINLAPGQHTFRVRMLGANGQWSQQTANLRLYIRPHFWHTDWIRATVLLALLATVWFIWKSRLMAIRSEAQLKQREAEFKQQLGELEMSSLRSQMNPHFIFNVLNSINRYTLDNDSESASMYLSKFAKLVRMVLENSRNERITLEKELQALELYIQMEAMRFKERLQYEIEIDPSVDMQFIKIPPLMIQPYVENAIWHGLMHRKEGGKITIKVAQPHESLLEVVVQDDGVGRARSAELGSKSATHKQSFGMQITSERLEMVNRLYKTNMQTRIEDLFDGEGKAAGTKVTISFPI